MISLYKKVTRKEDYYILNRFLMTPLFCFKLAPRKYRFNVEYPTRYKNTEYTSIDVPIGKIREIGYWTDEKGNEVFLNELEKVRSSYDYIGDKYE